MDRECYLYRWARHSRPQRTTRMLSLHPALSLGATAVLTGDKPGLRGGGGHWFQVKGEKHLPDIPSSSLLSFSLLFPTCLPYSPHPLPGLRGSPELCDLHHTQHREMTQWSTTSPSHLPFLFLFLPSSIFSFILLSNYHAADGGERTVFLPRGAQRYGEEVDPDD